MRRGSKPGPKSSTVACLPGARSLFMEVCADVYRLHVTSSLHQPNRAHSMPWRAIHRNSGLAHPILFRKDSWPKYREGERRFCIQKTLPDNWGMIISFFLSTPLTTTRATSSDVIPEFSKQVWPNSLSNSSV